MRIGWDEFIIVKTNSSVDEIKTYLKEVEELGMSIDIKGYTPSISFGYTLVDDFEKLLKNI